MVDCQWVFRKKRNSEREVETYTARLAAASLGL